MVRGGLERTVDWYLLNQAWCSRGESTMAWSALA